VISGQQEVKFIKNEVVLYAMLSGTVPFKANNMTDLHKLILKGNFNPIKDISEEASNLLKCILEIDVKKRFNAEQILNHPWMKINDNNGKFKTKSKIILRK
jgi:serine/threonine protein kinase